jgi:hypothetical protein
MGLVVEVGFLERMLSDDEEGAVWFREELGKLNPYLESCGLRAHTEPESCPIFSAEMYGYSGLHYLRRVAAHLELRGKLPEPGTQDAAQDSVLVEYFALLEKPSLSVFSRLFARKPKARGFDHLIFHSDAEGFYLPQDFVEVLFPPPERKISGGMIGSSQRLAVETARLAKALELPLTLDPESDEVFAAVEAQGEGEARWQRYGVESFTCLQLHHAAQHSIAQGAALFFT